MSNNIEIKAHAHDLDNLQRKVKTLCGGHGTLLKQRDVFYKLTKYRIKLRSVNGKSELLIYDRENTTGPKRSRYVRIPIPFPQIAHALLSAILGVRGVVEKERTLYLYGNTRIHLDDVVGLGTFMEFEVVLNDDESPEQGVQTAENLMQQLAIQEQDLISHAYIDLIESSDAV